MRFIDIEKPEDKNNDNSKDEKTDILRQKEKENDSDSNSNDNKDKDNQSEESSSEDEYFCRNNNKKKNTFVGTAEYVSPEVLLGETIGPECDLWAFGCMLYRFLAGKTPYKDKTEYLIFENIRKNKINFPEVRVFFIFLLKKIFFFLIIFFNIFSFNNFH